MGLFWGEEARQVLTGARAASWHFFHFDLRESVTVNIPNLRHACMHVVHLAVLSSSTNFEKENGELLSFVIRHSNPTDPSPPTQRHRPASHGTAGRWPQPGKGCGGHALVLILLFLDRRGQGRKPVTAGSRKGRAIRPTRSYGGARGTQGRDPGEVAAG